MTAKHGLLFLCGIGALGAVLWLTGSLPIKAAVVQARKPGAGVHGHVFVRDPAQAGGSRQDAQIVLPDVELSLKNVDSGQLSPLQRTDLFGRFMFPPQPPGTYKLVWERQNGWEAGEYANAIVITSNTQYPGPVEIKPGNGLTVLAGRVRMGDGGSPWYANEYFGILRFVEVGLVDAGGKEIGKRVRANFAGDYAIAAQAGENLRIDARTTMSGAKATRVLTAAEAIRTNGSKPLDLKLDNRRPILDSVVARADGKVVHHAPAGGTVQLTALASDPDKDPLLYTWKAEGGSIKGTGASVEWQLPDEPGTYTSYVIVSDGREGDAPGYVTVGVGTKGDQFSGRVVDPDGGPLSSATVTVDGLKTLTDASGDFRVVVAPNDRYLLNIQRAGFAPRSVSLDRPSNGKRWALMPVQVVEFDPTQKIDLTDTRRILAKKSLSGARVQLPAGSLVNAAGNKPVGKLLASLATLDPADDEAFATQVGIDAGMAVGLASYGQVFVEFTDAAGKKYNLAPARPP